MQTLRIIPVVCILPTHGLKFIIAHKRVVNKTDHYVYTDHRSDTLERNDGMCNMTEQKLYILYNTKLYNST